MKNIQNYIKTDVRHVAFLAITGQPTGVVKKMWCHLNSL